MTGRKINRLERLARREEQSIVKRIVVLSVISLVIIIIFLTAGIGLLGKFADLADLVFKNKTQGSASINVNVQAPILDDLQKFTNKSTITVSGFSNNASRVEINLNGKKAAETNVDSGRFKYEDLKLSDGDNEITAKAFDANNNQSDFSQAETVNFSNKEPKLEVSTPADGQTISGNNRISVQGQTQKDAQVFANGFLANVLQDGKFDVIIPLSEGDNNIEVKAVDQAGNEKTISLKVRFNK